MKLCPGCNGSNIKTELWGDWFATACQDCNWQTGFHNSEEESERAWNTRYTNPLLKEMAEELEGMVRQLSFGTLNDCETAEFRAAHNVLQKYHEQEEK